MSNNLAAVTMQFETLRSIAFGDISSTYAPVGTPLEFAARQFMLQNSTDAAIFFSLNGTDDHMVLPAGGFFLSDVMSNNSNVGAGWVLPAGSQWSVRTDGSPSSGSVYIASIYGYAGQ